MKTTLASFALTAFLVATGTSLTTSAQTLPIVSGAAPKIQFATTDFDFGKINNGAVVKHDFVFTNTGTAPLVITAVQPSCGCTTAGDWSRTNQPRQTGTIPIQFNSGNFSGPIHKTVTVSCNVPNSPPIILNLKGTIWKPIDVNPTYAYFTPASDSQAPDTKVVRIVNNTEAPLTLSAPECANKAFAAEIKVLKEGREFELHITANPPFAAGTIQGAVNVKTSSTNLPVISVNGIIMVQPVIVAMPASISLPPGPLNVATKMAVTLRNSGTNNVTVSDPVVNVPGVEATVQELQAGHTFNIMLTFPAGFTIKPTERAELTVKTSHPQYSSVRVSIFQAMAPFQQQGLVIPPRPVTVTNPAMPPRPAPVPLPPPPPMPKR